MMKFRTNVPLFASAATLLICSGSAVAQTGNEAGSRPEAQPYSAIEDIIVTARRRAESLQDAPVTVTAFSGADLQQKGITDVARLAQLTPGINFDAFPKTAPRIWFRGVGGGGNSAGGDPSSVAFFDGVYLARPAMLGIDFYDLEQVEVLKGPQGTLWGKNVVAGAVNFITAKPTDTLESSAQLTFGEYGQLNGNLMINSPIADGIAARLVIGAESNDGYRRTFDGRPLDDENKLSARLHVRAELGPDTWLLLSGDISDQNLSDTSRFNLFRQPFTPGKGYADLDQPLRANPDRLGFNTSKTGGARIELSTDSLGFANWTTTAAWRTLDFDYENDLDGTDAATNAAIGVPVSGLQTFQREWADSYSVETRLTSQGAGPLKWVAGLYYNHDDIHRERETQQSATPTTINRFFGDSTNDSYAAFGEAEYGFDFGLKLLAGGRYTKEKKSFSAKRLTGPIAAPVTAYDTAASPGIYDDGVFTYRLGANWRFNENIFAFGTISTGFKAGAFQEQPSSAALARVPTDPEKGTNYEVGVKTDWLDRRVRANVSGFIMKYRDFQTAKVVPDLSQGLTGTRVTVDTGDATIKGIETEVVVAPAPWFDATVRYTYIEPFFTRFIQTSSFRADGTPVSTDGAGNRLSRTPQHAVVADIGVQTPEDADWGWLRAQVTMDYQSDVFDNNINDFKEYRKPRTLWDASVTYHFDERFSVKLWGRNLTNKTYRIWQTNNDAARYHMVQYGAPRQLGVTLNAALR
ncbi:hypothetical protein C1T17_01760 [Sphingobium sp. SCG-1]|uniref:TonB-dependent receptor n=1 Tax=Sphingobium sp. SCG-1 TaxID=2072936 RepID=UPI000CD6B297|nr:TonB-dependent receptor [Sphingobium sp. SCG-1]AUW56995.1 hypothetical protein C1T17_01760 [Sphingobium sp. SCG-1]